jgi:hypothetical protein
MKSLFRRSLHCKKRYGIPGFFLPDFFLSDIRKNLYADRGGISKKRKKILSEYLNVPKLSENIPPQ